MRTIPLIVYDDTLRDGEQQAGLHFSYETKRYLFYQIAQVGVDYIDIMPAVDESEAHLVRELVDAGWGKVIAPATMLDTRFIDQCKACGVQRITLFCGLSDRLLFLRDAEVRQSLQLSGKTIDDNIPDCVIHSIRENMHNKVLENLRYATSEKVGLKVDFAAEDASRASLDFIVQCIRDFRSYIGHFMLCDTLGVLTPEKTYTWIRDIQRRTDYAPLGVHFHNDLGMAVENTIQGILAGATMINGTFGGIGERAGNVALEQVLNGLRLRFGIEIERINYDALSTVTDCLKQVGAIPAAPYSEAAQRHESGVHVHSHLRDVKSYYQFDFGIPTVWFGKYSGASNFQYLFERRLGKPLPFEKYEQLRDTIKALSIEKQRSFSTEEIIGLISRRILGTP